MERTASTKPESLALSSEGAFVSCRRPLPGRPTGQVRPLCRVAFPSHRSPATLGGVTRGLGTVMRRVSTKGNVWWFGGRPCDSASFLLPHSPPFPSGSRSSGSVPSPGDLGPCGPRGTGWTLPPEGPEMHQCRDQWRLPRPPQ